VQWNRPASQLCFAWFVACCIVVATAELFDSWHSCLTTKLNHQQQQQQPISRQFMSQVAFVWSRVFSLWHDIALWLGGVSKIAPVILRSAVPALQFADLCMQQAAPVPGASSSSSSGSSSSWEVSRNDGYSAALLLQTAVLKSVLVMRDWSAGDGPLGNDAVAASLDAAVEKAALQQLTGACALLHRYMHRSATQLQGAAAASSSSLPAGTSSCMDNRASSSSSCSSSSIDAPSHTRAAQHPAAPSVPAFHDSLLHLLPGGQAFVDAMAAAAAADAANTSTGNGDAAAAAAVKLDMWASVVAQLMYQMQIARCHMPTVANDSSSSLPTTSGENIAAAPVAQASTVYRQLLVQLQLLAAALFQQQQQQQQQQGDAPNGTQQSLWLVQLRSNNSRLLKYIYAVTRAMVQEECIGFRQLLVGDSPLDRALAAPLRVAEYWQSDDEQQVPGNPAEQLYASIACAQAADLAENGGNTPDPDAGEECCC
jgi:hypothetical protein